MNRDLRLQVVFSAVDKITGQLKGITQGGTAMADKLAAARKQLKALETQQKDVRGFQDLRRQVQQTSTALKDQQDKVKGLAQQMASTSNPANKLSREFNAAQKQAARLKREHAAQQTELQGLRTRLQQAGIQTKSLDDHDRRLRTEKQRLNRTIDDQTKKLKRLGEVQQKQKALNERHGRSMMHVGMIAGAGYAGMAAGRNMLQRGAAALMPGIDFGAQMSELQAVSRLDAADPRMVMLRQQAKDLGATTQFTAPEVGAGQTFLARAGFSPEAISSSMSDVLAMALANNTDLARTADIASNIAGAFKIDPEVAGNMTRVADVLSGTAARGNVNLEMMGDTMKYLGGAEDLGLSLEQAAAMSALLGNIGIQGSQAGTAMRAMMNRLTQPAALGIAAMEQINLEVSDAQGNLRAMPDILRDINAATRDMGSTERKSILQRIFGAEAGSGMAELVSGMSEGTLDDLIAALHNTAGENRRMADTMANNVRGDLDSLGSAWQSIGIEMSEVNDGPLRTTIQWITKLLLKVSGWIAENPKLAQTLMLVASTVGAVVAVLGTLALIVAGIAGPILVLSFSLAKLKLWFLAVFGPGTQVLALLKAMSAFLVANPITAALTALAVAGYLVWKNWEAIEQWFSGGGLGRITKAVLNFSPINGLWKLIVGGLKMLGAEIPDMFSTLGSAIVDGLIGGIKSKFFGVDKAVAELGDTASTTFKDELGINSPSRVFAEYGANTMQGYQQGLQRSENGPLRQITGMVKRLRNIGAGALVGALGLSSAAADMLPVSSLRVDDRPPIASERSGLTIQGGIHIAVTAAPGMNEQALANLVATEVQRALQQAQHQASAKQRSALYDID